jgi:acyl phosphate:glycerol-3-phosphate acyltransferase
MNVVGLVFLGYLAGSLPFSVWMGRLFLGSDVRSYGSDHNPGAANAWKAGKWKLGIPVLVLDFLKGALPVGLAYQMLDITGWPLLPVALAPVVGHAYSLFLRFKGGKAITVTFGIWTGLTLAYGPIVLGICMAAFLLILEDHAWAVICSMLAFLVFLLISQAGGIFIGIWFGNMLVIYLKHRAKLTLPIHFSPRIGNIVK